ncbi:helix-turn-helix domain-containing protein [Paenibacillus sp. IHBB 3054]|uniref:helix-turn-helix domain-containing protein n=1 Tax=Paenibacillus sp. IHBB 3054 TaxID=3425689 RepID=UPI003F671D95
MLSLAEVLNQKRLSVTEAAHYTGMSVDTIRTLCQQGQIPFYRSGKAGSKNGKILFRIETLDRWMEQQEKVNCPGWK